MEAAGKLDVQALHKDELPAIKAQQPGRVKAEWLERRNRDLLRQCSPRAEEIVVASALVLGVSQADLSHAVERAWNRGATVFFADSGLSLAPEAGVAGINAAMRDWQRARESVRTKPGRTAGYIAAAEKKRAETALKLKVVRPLWLSTKPDRMSMAEISAEADLSPKTIYRAVNDRQLPVRPRIKRRRSA